VATDWQAPTDLPDLRRVGIIAIDSEGKDEGLLADRGSAWPWRGGHISGISVAYRAGGEIRAHYFPIRHPDTPRTLIPGKSISGCVITSPAM